MVGIGFNLRVTGHSSQGGRRYMEDMFSIAYQRSSEDLEYSYCGIFDGHGGPEAAMYAKNHLFDAVVSQKNFKSDNDDDVLRAIHDGFIDTHMNMWKQVDKWPKTFQGLPSTSGTTATVAFIMRGKIYIGHVGDTCIVLGTHDPGNLEWRAKSLTVDHKPENKKEMLRIKRAGGKVMTKSGVHRVVWNRPKVGHQGPVRRSTTMDEIPFLAVARSLGDFWSYNSQLDQFVVSPEPDLIVHPIDTRRHRCLIFGTDGLWNILTPSAAVSLVQRTESHNEKQNGPMTWLNPSQCLVDKALEKWRMSSFRADNISCVVALLDPPGPPNSNLIINGQCTQFNSNQANSNAVLAGSDLDDIPLSGGLAIYTHPDPNESVSVPSCSSVVNFSYDQEESEDDDDDDEDEEEEELDEDSENEESDNNDDSSNGTNDNSLTEVYSSFVSDVNPFENSVGSLTSPIASTSPVTSVAPVTSTTLVASTSRSPSSVLPNSIFQRMLPLREQCRAPVGELSMVDLTLVGSSASTNEAIIIISSPECERKRSNEGELVNEENNSSDVENECVFIDSKKRRINIDKITNNNNNYKKPLMVGGSSNTENDVSPDKWFRDNRKSSWKTHAQTAEPEELSDSSSGEWFKDSNRKPSWKTPAQTAVPEVSSDTEKESSSDEWFVDRKKRKHNSDKKPIKLNWQKSLPVSEKIPLLKEKRVPNTKRTLRSDTSAAKKVKTLRSYNVNLTSSCDKIVSPKRESINAGDMLETKSVEGTPINSRKHRIKKAPVRWSPQIPSKKQYKSTKSQASRSIRK